MDCTCHTGENTRKIRSVFLVKKWSCHIKQSHWLSYGLGQAKPCHRDLLHYYWHILLAFLTISCIYHMLECEIPLRICTPITWDYFLWRWPVYQPKFLMSLPFSSENVLSIWSSTHINLLPEVNYLANLEADGICNFRERWLGTMKCISFSEVLFFLQSHSGLAMSGLFYSGRLDKIQRKGTTPLMVHTFKNIFKRSIRKKRHLIEFSKNLTNYISSISCQLSAQWAHLQALYCGVD